MRYLKAKYALIKDNDKGQIDNKRENEKEQEFPETRYETYEIEYFNGYNKGEAHFVNMVEGRYIFKIKSQKYNKSAKYILTYCSNRKADIK